MTPEEKLDSAFSRFIRLKYADYRGYVRCFTCTWIGHWKEADAGHWKKRQHHAVRWNEDNVRPQCHTCNRFSDGESDIFEEELIDEIGEEKVEAIENLASGSRHFDEQEIKTLTIHYQKEGDLLENGL